MSSYQVELLYESLPRLTGSDLLGKVRKKLEGNVRLREPMTFAYENARHIVSDSRPQALEEALAQSWDWQEAKAQADRAKRALVLTEEATLPRHDRLELFHAMLSTIVEAAAPLAIHWIPAQKLVDPRAYLKSLEETEQQDLLAAPINVRFFRGETEELLMDTMGLAPFGLPDVQAQFQGRDPGAVSRVLLNVAYYLFNEGDVLEPGHTVQGIDPGELWSCRRARATAPPERNVVDLEMPTPGEGE